MTNKPKKLIYAILVLAVVALVGWALLPQPLKVETAKVTAGPLHVTVDEEGQTRARDRYLIVAPADGRVARIALRDGDPIALDQPVAQLWPVPLSARERDEQLARIAAAEASLRAARSGLQRAEADARQKQRERARDEDLVKKNFVSAQVAEQSRAAATIAASDTDAAHARVRAAEADLRAAQAALLAIDEGAKGGSVTVRSPVAGRVLRIPERSERVVEAGTTLMTVGDPSKLEVVVDVLSQDAVKVRPGMPVLLVGWGEAKALDARVRSVEPYGFTKVSALGVEEQRVNIVADFVGGLGTLGDGYRVDARIVVWSADKVLKVPVSALFREGDKWAVFVVQGEHARHRPVEVGRRNGEEAQITSGLKEGETIVRHPPNTLKDGARVELTGRS